MHSGSSPPSDAVVKRRQRRNLLVIAGVLTAVILAAFATPVGFVVLDVIRIERQKNRLVNGVDHSSIASAAHQMLNDESLTRPEGVYFEGSHPDLPTEIRSLKSSYVHIEAGRVQIEFGGGFHHFGFLILPVEKKPESWHVHEYTKLSDGVWFYEQIE